MSEDGRIAAVDVRYDIESVDSDTTIVLLMLSVPLRRGRSREWVERDDSLPSGG